MMKVMCTNQCKTNAAKALATPPCYTCPAPAGP